MGAVYYKFMLMCACICIACISGVMCAQYLICVGSDSVCLCLCLSMCTRMFGQIIQYLCVHYISLHVFTCSVECSNCHHKIDRNEPSLEEYLQLQHHIHYVLEKDIQSFLDTKNTITEMIQLKELVKQEGSFRIVVDGLNVGFFQKREFSIDRVSIFQQTHFQNLFMKILICVFLCPRNILRIYVSCEYEHCFFCSIQVVKCAHTCVHTTTCYFDILLMTLSSLLRCNGLFHYCSVVY